MGDPRTLVSWRYYSRDGVDRLETGTGEMLEFSADRWDLYRNDRAVATAPSTWLRPKRPNEGKVEMEIMPDVNSRRGVSKALGPSSREMTPGNSRNP